MRTFATNRESILRHGLDWRSMSGDGIARSRAPEWPGVFLCASLEDVRFFVMIGSHHGVNGHLFLPIRGDHFSALVAMIFPIGRLWRNGPACHSGCQKVPADPS